MLTKLTSRHRLDTAALEYYLTGVESPLVREQRRQAHCDSAQDFLIKDPAEGRGRLRDAAAEGANRVFILMQHLGGDERDREVAVGLPALPIASSAVMDHKRKER